MKNDPNKNGMTYASHTLPSRVCVCEAYVIPFLFGSFFTVCHPYIDLHFVKCFLCYLFNYAWAGIDRKMAVFLYLLPETLSQHSAYGTNKP